MLLSPETRVRGGAKSKEKQKIEDMDLNGPCEDDDCDEEGN
jgi:hypothetical protein